MGSTAAKVRESPTTTTNPEFFWLHKNENAVLKIAENAVTAHPVPKLPIFENCSVGYTCDGNIVIAGGIKPSGVCTKKVFYVNIQNKSVNRLASLRIPSSGCSLISFNNSLALVPEKLNTSIQVYSSGGWSVLTPNELSLSFSAVLLNEFVLYFLSGIKANNKPTKKIYSLNLKSFESYKLSKKITPFKIHKPILVKLKSSVVVAGGKINGKENFRFFIGSLDLEKWKVIDGPAYSLGTGPGICVKDYAVWVEFPRVIVLSGFFCCVWNIDGDKEGVSERVEEKGCEKIKKKVEKRVNFKKTEVKEKKMSARKTTLEQNIIISQGINENLYVHSNEALFKEHKT